MNKTPPNKNGLSLRDIIILKMFLERAKREGFFHPEENHSAEVLHKKLTILIDTKVAEIRKAQEASQNNTTSGVTSGPQGPSK